ncbi:MAG: beta-lactamase family protein [Chlorobium sp.]|jgi:D-alanyl-D-alanine carboxypeptidase|nr:MAG: beta-lactamase family protein [Chlorobium sp.]
MKHFISAILITASLLLSACGSSKSVVDPVQSKIKEMVDTKFTAFKTANQLPPSAGVLVYLLTPQGTWTASSNLPEDVGANTHYRIASVTKTFTSAAIMLLDQQGKLRIDDPVKANIPGTSIPYLPDTPEYQIPFKAKITIRQLLSHRAGVFDVTNDKIPVGLGVPYNNRYYLDYVETTKGDTLHQYTFDELVGVAAITRQTYWAPNGGYHYSNTGYSLLAKIIERVSGKSYDRFLADNFFRPMGLKNTSAPWRSIDRSIPAPFLRGYSRQEASEAFIEKTQDNMSPNVAEGNLISTPADAARWMRMILSGKGPLNKAQIARMTTIPPGNESNAYALGFVSTSTMGIGHTGAHPGYLNLVVYNPQDDVTAVVLLNYTDLSDPGKPMLMMGQIVSEAKKIAGY